MKGKLTKKDIEGFKKKLLELKRKILGEIQHLTEDSMNKTQREASGELSSYTFHMADMASDNFDREFSFTLATNERELLYLIDEALAKIDSGEYGICELCGNPIGKMRLKAIPYAKYCISCQEEEERRRKRKVL